MRRRLVLCAAAALAACSTVNPHYDARIKHHRPDGFRNNYIERVEKPFPEFLRWRFEAFRDGLPKPPQTPTPHVEPDLAFIRANAGVAAMQPALTWIGHATVLAQFGGLNWLTDPHFTRRASPLSFIGPQRVLPPALTTPQLPRIDVVLVSHNHYDHLDEGSVVALNRQPGGAPLFIVPLGLKAWLAGVGVTNVVELDWWGSKRVADNVDVVLTPVQHWSGRSLGDRMQTLWGGFAVFAPDLHLYFGGDTGYSKDFIDTRERFAERQRNGGGFDIALIPVGAYEPRWFMTEQHVNPAEALQIHRDLGAKRSLGIHWGTFNLTDESLDEPPRHLTDAKRAQNVADDAFFVMAVGETRKLQRRTSTP